MPLSVSTSPADLSLASLLPGDTSPCAADSAGPATSFGAQFPFLASTPPAGPGGFVVAVDPTGACAPTTIAPTWIGSAVPQSSAHPRASSLPGKSATAPSPVVPQKPGDVLPSAVIGTAPFASPSTATAHPTTPSDGRPALRGACRDAVTLPPAANPLAAEMAQALALSTIPQPSAPVALALTETSPTPTDESATDVMAVSADASLPAGAAGTEFRLASLSSVTSSAWPSARTVISPVTPLTSSASASTSASAATGALRSAPDSGPLALDVPTATVDADALSAATRSFAPAEILSRQFAPTSRANSAPDLASSYGAPRTVAFAAAPPTTALAATAAPATDATVIAPLVPRLPHALSASGAPTAFVPTASLPSGAAPEIDTAVSPELSTVLIQSPADSSAPFASTALVASTTVAQREFSPATRVEKTLAPRGAKIAATDENVSSGKNRDEIDAGKTFVNLSSERVAPPGTDVGTGVAKSPATMPAPSFNLSFSTAVLEHAPVAQVAIAAADRAMDFSATSVLAPEPTVAAQRAVEAVLTAVERFSSGERHSVNLNFSVGGSDLNVRVELHADEVRATFHTDSPELRSALAHEWQAAHGASDSSERSQRLVTPVFTGNSASSTSSSSNLSSFSGGDGSSRQRESAARRAHDDTLSASSLRSVGSRSAVSVGAADFTPASPAPRSASLHSHRLHTHA